MAETMASTHHACSEVTRSSANPASPIARRFLAVSHRLGYVARCSAALDEEVPWSPTFHAQFRALEQAEERLANDLPAILAARPLSTVDHHLQNLAWRLHMALSLEDGEDRRFFLGRMLAWPELLYFSDDVPDAEWSCRVFVPLRVLV